VQLDRQVDMFVCTKLYHLLPCQTSGERSAVDIELFLQLQQKQLFSLRASYIFAYTCALSNVQYQCLELTLKSPLGLL
jgi:hypothetical protein